MGWLSDFVSDPVGTTIDTVSNVVSDPLGSIDRATRGVGDTLEQAAPAILAAVDHLHRGHRHYRIYLKP